MKVSRFHKNTHRDHLKKQETQLRRIELERFYEITRLKDHDSSMEIGNVSDGLLGGEPVN